MRDLEPDWEKGTLKKKDERMVIRWDGQVYVNGVVADKKKEIEEGTFWLKETIGGLGGLSPRG